MGNLAPQHLSQWKPVRKQQAIQHFVPGACLPFELALAGDGVMFYRRDRLLNSNQSYWFNPSHTCLVCVHFVRSGISVESVRQETEEETGASRPENQVGDCQGTEADGETVTGLQSARGNERFDSIGLVHYSTSTCNGGSNKAAYSAMRQLWVRAALALMNKY